MRARLRLLIVIMILLCLTVSGVSAQWVYRHDPEPLEITVEHSMGHFTYPPFYITSIRVVGGDYSNATFTKTGDTNIEGDITLNKNTSSTVVVEVTFYNGSDVSYYYNETETVSTDNDRIIYEVSGIEQKEEIPSKTYKTLTVTFSFSGNNTSKTDLLSELHFNFVVDKDSIGVIAAQTAVTRFADILNDVVFEDSYQTLENYMNDRGSNASTVSYVGNVAGANNADSQFIQQLFTNEFLNMDLDGDGKSEPITLMIKRENLDGNTNTGDSYAYSGLFGREQNVYGAEMTIYITSEGFGNNTLVVYAAAFTKINGNDEWIQVVPLTKGTATANNYSTGSFGTDNSFNTDTWKSNDGNTIDTLVKNAIAEIN